jgi:hypothetical protein
MGGVNHDGPFSRSLAENPDDVAPTAIMDIVRQVLLAGPMTRDEIRQSWPEYQPPPRNTLWRWLTRACDLGLLVRTGAGSRAEVFRFELANAGGEEDVETA